MGKSNASSSGLQHIGNIIAWTRHVTQQLNEQDKSRADEEEKHQDGMPILWLYLTSCQSIGWVSQQSVAALADCSLSLIHDQSADRAALAEWDTVNVTTGDINNNTVDTTSTTSTVADSVPADLCCVADHRFLSCAATWPS